MLVASLVALGGIVFSGITVALFELVTRNPAEWYARNVGVVGVAAVPVAGTYLYDAVFKSRTGIASVLSRVFARIVVLGANIVILAHLAWLCRAYAGMTRRSRGMSEVRRAVAGYLPAYVVWATLVAFLLPVVFRFS